MNKVKPLTRLLPIAVAGVAACSRPSVQGAETERPQDEAPTLLATEAAQPTGQESRGIHSESPDPPTPAAQQMSETCARLAEVRARVLLIGDGMGFRHVDAGRIGNDGPLSFETFPVQGQVTTASADAEITDSAASATAMATGHKVDNLVVAQATPGDGSPLETIVESYERCGFRTGLVTNSRVTHATPASFAAHEPSRWNELAILADYFSGVGPDLLVGGAVRGWQSVSRSNPEDPEILQSSSDFLSREELPSTRLFVLIGGSHLPYVADRSDDAPSLPELVEHSINLLDDGETPYFLMVEGARIDHASHDVDFDRMWPEVVEFSEASARVREAIAETGSWQLVVTADHECGGLTEVETGEDGLPSGRFTTDYHTAANVPVYIDGSVLPDRFDEIDNTDIYKLVTGTFGATD